MGCYDYDLAQSRPLHLDAEFVYVCVATNTWKRTALTTW